jgi:hypothetical protein
MVVIEAVANDYPDDPHQPSDQPHNEYLKE